VIVKLGKKVWTPWRLADAVLIVLDREYVVHNGELDLYVNPRLTLRQWCLKAEADSPALEWLLHTRPDQWSKA
jgi:hypothetical protein